MGFNIHVTATGGIHYSRRDIAYGDEWELNFVERQLLSQVGIRNRSLTGSAVPKVLNAMSRIVQAYTLQQAIELLFISHGEGRIVVRIRHEHWFWPDTGGISEFGGDETQIITRDILRFLHRNGMNKWGPILELIGGLTHLDQQLQGQGNYMIIFTFSD